MSCELNETILFAHGKQTNHCSLKETIFWTQNAAGLSQHKIVALRKCENDRFLLAHRMQRFDCAWKATILTGFQQMQRFCLQTECNNFDCVESDNFY